MIDYENLRKLNQPFVEGFHEAYSRVLESGWYILGNEVKLFEEAFASYCQVEHCVGVANGPDALILALRSFDLEPGDEVIVPSNTYIATILAIVQEGLKPVLVEPDIRTYNIDPWKIQSAITTSTRVIMPVHLYGKCCDMKSICSIADKYGLKIIEDAAQAHGARQGNGIVGSFGDFAAFSFYPTKNLGALGDAGALTTRNAEMNVAVRRLRNYGSDVKYYNEVPGVNSRLDELQAAFLSYKLQSLDKINQHKRKLAGIYLQGLKSDFILPYVDENYFDVYHIFNVRHEQRDELKTYLLNNGIRTEIHYPVPPVKQKAMRGIIDHFHTPIADLIHSTTLSLPISYFHTENDISQIIEVMNKF